MNVSIFNLKKRNVYKLSFCNKLLKYINKVNQSLVTKKGFPGGSAVKNPPAVQEPKEAWLQALGGEDSPGEGHGSSLQYSCLANPRDRAWWATVHRATKNQTQLKQLGTHTCL